MSINIETDSQEITATRVGDDERMDFLPGAFGTRLFMRGEMAVYGWMGRLCAAYRGGFWDFFTLSNGGFYMAPQVADGRALPIVLGGEGNGYAGEMSADAAGIVVTLMTLSHLAFESLSDDDQERVVLAFHRLREYAQTHAESRKILAAID